MRVYDRFFNEDRTKFYDEHWKPENPPSKDGINDREFLSMFAYDDYPSSDNNFTDDNIAKNVRNTNKM